MGEHIRELSGPPTPRVDGRLKVTGAAAYGTDFAPDQPAFAYLKTSSIAKGRITAIDEAEARSLPGVIEIFTFRNVGERIKPGKTFDQKGYMGTSIAPLLDDRVAHDGQIVAVVVAETFESARDAAHRLRVTYAEEPPSATFDSPGLSLKPANEKKAGGEEGAEDPKKGDFASAFTDAPVKVDNIYETPAQHHNPLELFGSTAAWADGKLTIWESSQNVYGFKNGVAEQLGISPDDVRVVSPFIGGGFGSRGSLGQHTALLAHAARVLKRPVKLVATRDQAFTIMTYRAETRHRVQLAATRDGKLTALRHEGWEITSRPDDYKVSGTDASTRLYACPNIDSKVWIQNADRNTPGFMRSPPEVPYIFALESAMDELAYALNMDPVRLRLLNDTMAEPIRGLPYTSRNLKGCFEAASEAFGWNKRSPEPQSMRDGDWLIGWGTATSLYPTNVAPCAARVRLSPDGTTLVQCATHEIGQGVRTVMAIIAAEELGLPVDRVTVEAGDTALPPAPVAGGSNSTASVSSAVAKACGEIRDRLARASVADVDSPLNGKEAADLRLVDGTLALPDGPAEPLDKAVARVAPGIVEAYVENVPNGAKPESARGLYKGQPGLTGGAKLKDRIQFAFGAQFVEVRVHARTGEVRAPRAVGAFSFGRIVNPKTAKSQLMGGQIWGISAALYEATEIDRRVARYYNDDLAEYMIPVNADVPLIETIMLPERDEHVPLGIKGVGELGNVGLNAAVANAVFHATGVRVRRLPVRIEKLLGGLQSA